MWRKLRKQIAVEREMLHQLFEDHRPLLTKCAISTPDRIELPALGAFLHCFYSGVENIFKRVVTELNEDSARTGNWHRQLIKNITQHTPERPAVISEELARTLEGYLDFRHVFRHAYTFQLQWERMAHLVLECEATFQQFDKEISTFLNTTQFKE